MRESRKLVGEPRTIVHALISQNGIRLQRHISCVLKLKKKKLKPYIASAIYCLLHIKSILVD